MEEQVTPGRPGESAGVLHALGFVADLCSAYQYYFLSLGDGKSDNKSPFKAEPFSAKQLQERSIGKTFLGENVQIEMKWSTMSPKIT